MKINNAEGNKPGIERQILYGLTFQRTQISQFTGTENKRAVTRVWGRQERVGSAKQTKVAVWGEGGW